MSQMHPLIRKALALTLLIGVFAAIWYGGVEPLWQRWLAQEDSIARSENLLARYAATNAQGEVLDAELKRTRATRRAQGRFLEGESVELAGAQLQEPVVSLKKSRPCPHNRRVQRY